MIAPLQRFPFKNMLQMVEVVVKLPEGAPIEDIARGSNSCYPDTMEVTQMASFLTRHGRVLKERNGWRLTPGRSSPNVPLRFRTRFLYDIHKILLALGDEPQDAGLIALKTALSRKMVEGYLKFLEKITRYGMIVKGKGEFYLVPWDAS